MFKFRINQWLFDMKKYFFTYRDGFFDLPYLSNSPAVMVDSFKNMPFTKFLAAEKEIHTHNIFTDGVMRYAELEDGLWIIITEIAFKKKVSTHALYDQEPTDYHFLSYFVYTSLIDQIGLNEITIPTNGWGFYKPGTEIKAYFNKGDEGIFANFVFTKSWFERNVPLKTFASGNDFGSFFESTESYKTWDNLVPGSEMMVREILALLKARQHDDQRTIPLKMLCLQIISQFFISITHDHKVKPQAKLHDHDTRLIARAEKLLIDNLTTAFPGVEEMAQKLHTSSTKLQSLFKIVYQTSIFQYYRDKQMVLALQMLKAKPISVKEIASIFGYQSPSKFSAAFKKYHHFSPTDLSS